MNSYLQPENGHADVFIPISVATERRGHYTNFEGTVSAFEPCFAKPAGVADAATVFAAIAARRRRARMMQDLVVSVVFIGYAVAVLLTFGTVLTWVERKQAAIMSDRIGANRAYVRIPFTQVKLIWLGLFHGLADGIKMMLKEDFRPDFLRPLRLRARAVGRVHAGAARLRGHSLRRHARAGRAAANPAVGVRVVRRPELSHADRARGRGSPRRLRVRGTVDHRRDARRLVVGQQVLAAGRAARRLADDLLRARHGAHGAGPHPHLRNRRPRRDRAAAVGRAAGVPAGVGRLPAAVRGHPLPGGRDRREQAHSLRPARSGVGAHRRLFHRIQRDEDGAFHVRRIHRDRDHRRALHHALPRRLQPAVHDRRRLRAFRATTW